MFLADFPLGFYPVAIVAIAFLVVNCVKLVLYALPRWHSVRAAPGGDAL